MRLIDVDALPRCKKASFINGRFIYGEEFVFVRDIDAAPTICCKRCARGEIINSHCGLVVDCTPKACWMDLHDACPQFTDDLGPHIEPMPREATDG